MPLSPETGRLDRWLWMVRLFKTRTLATAACRDGRLKIDDVVAKPAREIRVGEVVTLRDGLIGRVYRVVAIPASRIGAKLVPTYYEDRTPAAEIERAAAARVQQVLARDRGAGRPTKRDRRHLDDLLDQL